MSIRVNIWGCRGSIACPAPTHLKYGGNTTSVEVVVGDQTILLDCGTGIRNLGQQMIKTDIEHCHMLLTHTHWDHINGFPFFAPAFDPNRKFDIMAGHMIDKGGIKNVFEAQMENPMFPIPLEAMQSKMTFTDFRAGDDLDIGETPGVKVSTALLRHPNDATGYRIDYQGKSMCLITDTEHVPGEPDENILTLIEGADLVIYDGTYTDDEFPNHITWGHSTWQEGLRMCEANDVKRYVLFHHDPGRDDDQLDEIGRQLEALRPGTVVAREGLVLNP